MPDTPQGDDFPDGGGGGGVDQAAVDAAVATHAADTTSVHGVADTSALVTQAEITGAVDAHSADTSVHGIADTTALATDAEVATAVSDHSADTTNVHGIVDTALLLDSGDLASAAETTTGTSTAKAITPDGLAGSDYGKRIAVIPVTDPNGASITTGDGKAFFPVPQEIGGWNLVAAHAAVTGQSSSGAVTVQIHNRTAAVDMLSTAITIDANEDSSYTAATPPVVNAANDDVQTGEILRVDVDGAGTSAEGLFVILTFQLP